MSSKPYQEIDAKIVYAESPVKVKTERLLVVVDYQTDFVDGVFGTNPLAVAVEEPIYNKIKEAEKQGDRIVFTMDTHPSSGYEEVRESNLYPIHCDPATDGWKLYGKVGEFFGKYDYIEKCTFGAKLLVEYIEAHPEIKTIELVGVSTSICVFNNAILCANMFPGCEIKVDYDCCAAFTPEDHDTALKGLQGFGCVIENTPEGF